MKAVKERVAVVGAGISGIVSAFLLSQNYDVTLIESNKRVGGHAYSVPVEDPEWGQLYIDTGFIVFNLLNYPLFTTFLNRLEVSYQDSDMSFGYYHQDQQFWYSSDFPSGFFAQRFRLFSGSHWKLIYDIHRLNNRVRKDLALDRIPDISLGDYLLEKSLSDTVKNRYLLPMAAAIWSCPLSAILAFPAKRFFQFWENHCLLQVQNRPKWKTVSGGSQAYVSAFLRQFKGAVMTGDGATGIEMSDKSASIELRSGQKIQVDKVVIAIHANQALALLKNPTRDQQNLLGAWQYTHNLAVLHTDQTVMPPSKQAWSSWLVHDSTIEDRALQITYYMNRLQSLKTTTQYFVTLNPQVPIQEDKIIKKISYAHPFFDNDAVRTQPSLQQLNTGPVFFAGSYFGYGFHEDGVKSAVTVAEALRSGF